MADDTHSSTWLHCGGLLKQSGRLGSHGHIINEAAVAAVATSHLSLMSSMVWECKNGHAEFADDHSEQRLQQLLGNKTWPAGKIYHQQQQEQTTHLTGGVTAA